VQQVSVRNKKTVSIILAAVVAVAVALLLNQLGVYKFPWESAPKPVGPGAAFPGHEKSAERYISGMTTEELREYMQSLTAVPQLMYRINANPVFSSGRSKGNLGIENPEQSKYPMVVQIFLTSTGELVYDSGGLLPGSRVDQGRLLKNLSDGSYEAMAVFNAFDPQSMLWQGKEEASLTIAVGVLR